jgi:hypothetical protein
MKFETAFNCGDKAWTFDGEGASQVTVGQVQVTYTHSKGLNGGRVDPDIPVAFDNFKPKKATYEERYMCIETGIVSGSIYTLGQSIFRTREECEQANAERIEQNKRHKEEMRRIDIERAQRRIEEAQAELRKLGISA